MSKKKENKEPVLTKLTDSIELEPGAITKVEPKEIKVRVKTACKVDHNGSWHGAGSVLNINSNDFDANSQVKI